MATKNPGLVPASAKRSRAHVRQNEDGVFEIHHFEEHLRTVSDLGVERPW